MSRTRYSIGIDLGTTNCAIAFEADDGSGSQVLAIPQWDKPGARTESDTLPSFLYLPTDEEAESLGGRTAWVAGRLARRKSAETPGRVVHSAKSWLCHHVLDRSKPFLPWHSDSLDRSEHISPVQASAVLLQYLKTIWDRRFPDAPFDRQSVTITVPASFDPVAQKLTLEAATQAGFPDGVRLIEEPQAAFYRWLEQHQGDDGVLEALSADSASCVAVVDIGGGTSDFSLFEVSPATPLPRIRRIAVSDHLLLGGDNIDLAIAHRIAEDLPPGSELAPVQWSQLVARSREIKERCLAGSDEDEFSVSIPGRGSGLFGGTMSARIGRDQVRTILTDGFFPDVPADAEPARDASGLREFALPYAADSAITRYLAEFLNGRPRVDAILFNGGSLHPETLRQRLVDQVGRWQGGHRPIVLENPEPDLAVARGAARFGSIIGKGSGRIEAGAARAVYLEVRSDGPVRQLLCVLPHGAEAGEASEVELPGLELTLGRPVVFQSYYSTRRSRDKAGAIIPWDPWAFHPLPPLRTVAKSPGSAADRVPIRLSACMNELGLIEVVCASTDPRADHSWPLEFDLRPHEGSDRSPSPAAVDPGVPPETIKSAEDVISSAFRETGAKQKPTANKLLKQLEATLGLPKHEWNGSLLRSLWSSLSDCLDRRTASPDHEEAWLIMAGYLLRPGFGAEGDAARIDELWRIHENGPAHPGKRIALQQYIIWRRVAGGLNADRQHAVFSPDLGKLDGKKVPAELIRLAGALERLDPVLKERLASDFSRRAAELARAGQHCDPWFVALGLILNRAPFYAGPSSVLPPEVVVECYETLRDLDWSAFAEIPTLFLRAARVVDHAAIDLPGDIRRSIARQLEDAGVPSVKVERVREYLAIESTDQAGLFGESLPPGLTIGRDR